MQPAPLRSIVEHATFPRLPPKHDPPIAYRFDQRVRARHAHARVNIDPSSRVGAGALRRRIADAAHASARFPILTTVIALVLTLVASWFVAHRFAIDTDSSKLISSRLPWRERSAMFDAAFPQRSDLVAIVVDGATPEIAERASATLATRLAAKTDLLRKVRRPDGGPFFERNGLLFLEVDEVAKITEQLVAAQPVLGTLAADPTVRGLMGTLQLALEGVKRGDTTLDALHPGLTALAGTLEGVADGKPSPLAWRSMLGGRPPDPRELRRFILVRPVLDYSALKPGEKATQAIRAIAREAALDDAHGVRVRLTGNVPMADEEFGTLEEHAGRNAAVMLGALLAMLWLAVRSLRATFAIVACLVTGLAITAAIGLAMFGALNLISVAFAVLFVGLGVDFGIQYAVAYRATARPDGADPIAFRDGALDVGGSLALAAVGIAAGFFAFQPTDYRGVSELGVIAGIGMGIAFIASITLLPALLRLLRVGGMPEGGRGLGFRALAPVDRVIATRRRPILVGASLVALVGLASVSLLRFDFDPLHLRSSDTEAVSTLMDLARDPQTSPDTLDVLMPSLDAAKALAPRLSALPEVSQVLTFASFVPANQEPKLALVADAALLLQPTLEPVVLQPAPSYAETTQALRDAGQALQSAANATPASPAAADAGRVARALIAVADGPASHRVLLENGLIPGLETTLAQVRASLQAAPVTLETLPAALKSDWIASDGRARIEVFPRTGSSAADADERLTRFIAAVRTVAPDATGAPVSIQESARTIIHAFVQAGVLALIAICVLLVAVLRNVHDVLVTLASLLLGGLATLALCVAFGIRLNYANIIALPLLFGIGVAFNIYFVIAWRHGVSDLLQTSLARAVIFSALTTATAFGSLWLSSHPGTASMGKLLALSLVTTLAAVLLFQPALMGKPRDVRE